MPTHMHNSNSAGQHFCFTLSRQQRMKPGSSTIHTLLKLPQGMLCIPSMEWGKQLVKHTMMKMLARENTWQEPNEEFHLCQDNKRKH